jgi:competence protein ComEA
VVDALGAAGGAAEEADLDRINLAAKLADEAHVAVPRKGEALPTTVSAAPTGARAQASPTRGLPPGATVNINSASIEELEVLPGIGPALAARIVAYRQANGPFRTVDELAAVSGIGDTLVERLRPYVTTQP